MASRRDFLAGLLAASASPIVSWADAGNPSYLSAARKPDGSFVLVGLAGNGDPVFEIPLPGRGHAAAAHPQQPLAVAFARRPGRFALVINCVTGQIDHRIDAPEGRHFYGHGTFSDDGSLLFTTENDYDAAQGRIGVWDARHGYRRVDEFSSGGLGPHDLKLMPNGRALVVANGGIETHPESGRTKLNIPTMRSNLSYLSLDGSVLEQVELDAALRRASLRHLAVRGDGMIVVGCQWQGPQDTVPLVYTHQSGTELHPLAPADPHVDLKGYIGSVALSGDGALIAATSPRSNTVLLHDVASRSTRAFTQPDVCGAAASARGIALTTGTGAFLRTQTGLPKVTATAGIAFDNHLVSI